MNRKQITVIGLVAIVAVLFYLGMNAYQNQVQVQQEQQVQSQNERLVRMHSPVFGPQNAPVTIVEFFDPACETCRAMYPIVQQLMARYPTQVKLVLRYAPFHQGSDQVVKLLEAAKRQGKYEPVLEALLQAQPRWADHGQPNLQIAFDAAAATGLDMAKAQADMQSPEIQALLQQDIDDLTALQVTKTPTFLVNGRSLPSFGPEQLFTLVAEEVAKAQAR